MMTLDDEYLVVKWLHVLSSTILFGTGIGSAFYMLMASLGKDPRVVYATVRKVVLADWLFTSPTVVIQPLTGFWLVHLAGFPLGSTWLAVSIALYLVAGACWLPVVWLQIRMREMARVAVERGEPLPPGYFAYLRVWVALGIPAFVALVAVFYFMVAKPA